MLALAGGDALGLWLEWDWNEKLGWQKELEVRV